MGYTVNSVKKAWSKANEIFPGDYQHDTEASAGAGYPIYMSTVKGSTDHISDLGCRLEVNIGAESINIWIEEDPEIAELKKEVAELKAALEKEEEWKVSENSGTQMSQDDYLALERCGNIMTEDKAAEWVAEEFGFSPKAVKIKTKVGTYEVNRHRRVRDGKTYDRKPIYCSTDWNYVRFNITGNVTWQYEAVNGELHPYMDWN